MVLFLVLLPCLVLREEDEGVGGRDQVRVVSERVASSSLLLVPSRLARAVMEFSLQDELAAVTNGDVQVTMDVESMDPTEVNASLNCQSTRSSSVAHQAHYCLPPLAIVDTITGESSAIQEQDVFDTLRSLLK